MDGVFKVLEEINRWLYGYLRNQWVCDMKRGKSSRAKWMHLETGKVFGKHLLGGSISSHCMRASVGMTD